MSPEVATLVLFAIVFVLFGLGFPIAFAMAGAGLVGGIFLWGWRLPVLATSTLGALSSEILIAIPLFILMGAILETSGMADDIFEALYYWSGPIRGGIAMGGIVVCAIFGAICGTSAAPTVVMGRIALPAMIKRNYDKHIALGTVGAGGLLGLIIPPSVLAIIFASTAALSIGKLYMGMLIPGLLLSFSYILYIGVKSAIQPKLCPEIPKDSRPSWPEKFKALRAIILPILIVGFVFGSIISGAATPTEAAGVGAASVFIASAIRRSLTWQNIKDSVYTTMRLTCMIAWMMIGIAIFSNVYNALGAPQLIKDFATKLPMGGLGVIVLMQISILILGMIMDTVAIILMCTPIYLPIILLAGFDPIWFGVIFMINLQIAWLSPPYGFNLFYMRAIAPPDISMGDIYLSVMPFIFLQLIVLILIMLFPGITLWLPSLIFG